MTIPPRGHAPDWLPEDLFCRIEERVRQLDLERQLDQAILDHVLDTSHTAILRAVHSADFIHRVIEVTPSLSAYQQEELGAIADELIAMVKRLPSDAKARALAQLRPQSPRDDPLEELRQLLMQEWKGAREDWRRLRNWL
jgi:hypothetical protein